MLKILKKKNGQPGQLQTAFMSTDAEASEGPGRVQLSLREALMELQLLNVQQFHKRTV